MFMQKPLKFVLPILIRPSLSFQIACVLTPFLGRGLLPSFLAKDPSHPGWRWYNGYRLRRHPAEGPATCVMQISLDDWICLPIDVLRNKILGPPGMRKRFQAAKRRFCKFKDVLLNYWQMQLLGNSKRTHLAPPIWRDDDSCHCCGQLLQFSTRPRILYSNCVAHTDISSDLFQKWCSISMLLMPNFKFFLILCSAFL